jgi:hypothetical protein
MKTKYWLISIITVFSICLLFTTPVMAQSPTPQPEGPNYQGDKVVVANTYRLQSGESLTGNLAVIGGTATIEKGATITGDIVLTGGTITVNGTINGNLVAIGGAANLGENAVVNGDIVTVGASLKKADTAKVTGNITEQTPAVDLGKDNGWQFPWKTNQNLLSKLITAAFESLALAAFAVVIGLVLPQQTSRIANTIHHEALVAGGVGLLTIVGSPILLVILIITIILIPVALLFVLVFGLAFVFGWIALGNLIGEQLAKFIHVNWAVPVASGIGTLILSLVVGTMNLLPCVGWIVGFIFGLLGLGAVIMTRFGSADSTPQPLVSVNNPLPPTPPAPPQNPEVL